MTKSYQKSVGGAARVGLAIPTETGGNYVFVTVPASAPVGVYLGGNEASLTTTTGFFVNIGTVVGPIRLSDYETLYAIGASGTTTAVVGVMRTHGDKS